MTSIGLNLLPFIPLFLFSLITYKMRDEVYRTWGRFASWWIPLSMLAILFSPQYGASMFYSIDKSSAAFISSLLFVLVSLFIVVWKLLSSRRTVA